MRGSSSTAVLEILEAAADAVQTLSDTQPQHPEQCLHTVVVAQLPQPSRMRLMSFISSGVMGFRLNPFSSGLPVRMCRTLGFCYETYEAFHVGRAVCSHSIVKVGKENNLRASNPTPTYCTVPTDHVCQCCISAVLGHLQGRRSHQPPWAAVPLHCCSSREQTVPIIQPGHCCMHSARCWVTALQQCVVAGAGREFQSERKSSPRS